jgi:hypothetical protein
LGGGATGPAADGTPDDDVAVHLEVIQAAIAGLGAVN